MLAIYRIGFYIPLPIVDQAKLQTALSSNNKAASARSSAPSPCSAAARSA